MGGSVGGLVRVGVRRVDQVVYIRAVLGRSQDKGSLGQPRDVVGAAIFPASSHSRVRQRLLPVPRDAAPEPRGCSAIRRRGSCAGATPPGARGRRRLVRALDEGWFARSTKAGSRARRRLVGAVDAVVGAVRGEMGSSRMSGMSSPSAIDKTLMVLDAVLEHSRFTDVVNATGLAKSTVHRIMAALVAHESVSQAEDGSYHPGPKALRLAVHALTNVGLATVARPVLADLVAQTRCTVHVGLLNGDEAIYV